MERNNVILPGKKGRLQGLQLIDESRQLMKKGQKKKKFKDSRVREHKPACQVDRKL